MAKSKLKSEDVLVYRKKGASQATVYRHYLKWREKHGIPVRCDNENCQFHLQPLVWNGAPFKPILDHKEGVNSDNRPEKLQLLCPNCDSLQTATRGGANKGRVTKSEGGFAIKSKATGKVHHTMPIEPATIKLTPEQLLKFRQKYGHH